MKRAAAEAYRALAEVARQLKGRIVFLELQAATLPAAVAVAATHPQP